jgi:hypothetical protein
MHELLGELSTLLETGQRLDVLHDGAVSLLGDIATGRARFPAVRHPLGFLYAPLLREQRRVLRLHIWLRDAPRPALTTSPIHDHTWRLTSFVICGELENQMIHVEDTEHPTHRVFEIRGAGSDDFLKPTERLVRFRCSSAERVKQGCRYVMAAREFHFTQVAPDVTTATMVLAQRQTTAPERSLGPLNTSKHHVIRMQCSFVEFAEAAEIVLATLGSQKPLGSVGMESRHA